MGVTGYGVYIGMSRQRPSPRSERCADARVAGRRVRTPWGGRGLVDLACTHGAVDNVAVGLTGRRGSHHHGQRDGLAAILSRPTSRSFEPARGHHDRRDLDASDISPHPRPSDRHRPACLHLGRRADRLDAVTRCGGSSPRIVLAQFAHDIALSRRRTSRAGGAERPICSRFSSALPASSHALFRRNSR